MKLTELNPRFYRYQRVERDVNVVDGDPATWRERGCPTKLVHRVDYNSVPVEAISEAQSIWFICPKCANQTGPGTGHFIECTIADRGVPNEAGSHNKAGNPVRWSISGTKFSNLSLRPSVLVEEGCCWHGFVTNGEVL